jgi:hypothetical protein
MSASRQLYPSKLTFACAAISDAAGHDETKCIAAEKRLFDHLVGADEKIRRNF